MLTIPELLARAHDCERLADNSEFGPQRALLLELAAKWRRLAAHTRSMSADQDGQGTGGAPRAGTLH
jgi:hypothetical protein